MRDRDEYQREGRNDPLSPEQLREHPYDFVSLPGRRKRAGEVVTHDRYSDQRLSGTLTLVYETLSPLHIGSGVLERAADCGLEGGAMPVRGMTRRQGRPVLPGSGWKGAVRSRFEAITGSRLAVVGFQHREPAFKVPEVLRERDAQHRVSIDDPQVRQELAPLGVIKRPEQLEQLSPAESLFGCMGYRGRVHPGDGVVDGHAATVALQVAPLESPVAHRLARPGHAAKKGRGGISITEVEGRKYYYDGEVVATRQAREGRREGAPSEYLDNVPAGCTITIEVHLQSLSRAEIGALLVSAGYGEGTGIMRFGGFKPVGLGKVALRSVSAALHRGAATRSWRRPQPEPLQPAEAVEAAMSELIDQEALRQLHEVTTRRRPGER